MLKITAPFREKKEVIPLIEAGADELYCGYLSPGWIKKYTTLEFERKGGIGSNFTDLKELKQAVEIAHKKDTPVYLSLNGLYVRRQYPLLLRIVKQLNKIDLDGYIVADIGLLLTLKRQGFKKQVHISTGGTVFNSEAARFYKNLGASRIILDRQTSLASMASISEENPDIDFEVFILNTLCVYIDGLCTFLHTYASTGDILGEISKKEWKNDERFQLISTYAYPGGYRDPCLLKYSFEVYDQRLNKKLKTNKIRPTFYKQLSDSTECAACAIYDINRTKIKNVKIVGRQLSPEERLQGTKFIRSCLDILKDNQGVSRKDFISGVQRSYQETYDYKKQCRGNNCYHPGVLHQP